MSKGKNNRVMNIPDTDDLDAFDQRQGRNNFVPAVSNRQRRNQQRAANFRNQVAMNRAPRVPVPVPVVDVGQARKPSFRLPNSQVWVKLSPTEWAAKTTDTNDAIPLRNIFNGITEITDETKIFRLLIGFVAESDGSFGIVDGVTDNKVPELPIVGREGFKKDTYRSRQFDLGGSTKQQLNGKAIVWSLSENRQKAKRVCLADYWLAISRPKPLMPPEDFLVNSF